jgi:hypothetical protein
MTSNQASNARNVHQDGVRFEMKIMEKEHLCVSISIGKSQRTAQTISTLTTEIGTIHQIGAVRHARKEVLAMDHSLGLLLVLSLDGGNFLTVNDRTVNDRTKNNQCLLNVFIHQHVLVQEI